MTTCPICKQRKGEVPIQDDTTGSEMWICEQCDADLFDARTLQERLVPKINVQIAHHRAEGNEPAIRSLEYIKDFMLNKSMSRKAYEP